MLVNDREGGPGPVSVAFVVSGGASLGAIQVGMLLERRITPDLIIGTSIGAVNGAYLASRPATPATADALADVLDPGAPERPDHMLLTATQP
ncbi:MAG: patatin-like phospholipase family protein [Pseudonocardiaceae bacterium]